MSDDEPAEKTLLNWTDMPHYRQPREPKPLPTSIHAQLHRMLTVAQTLCQAGDLDRVAAAAMLRSLGLVVRREQAYLQRKASELHFSEADRKLASKIEALLFFGGEGPEYSREEISNYLHRNKTSEEISRALALLRRSGRALSRERVRFAGHKPAELWRLTLPDDDIRRYPPVPADAGLPQPPQRIYAGVVARPPGAELTWALSPAKPVPIWGDDRDPRVRAAVARWEARQRGDNPRVAEAEAEARPKARAAAFKRARWK
jgi:hypothetical protein